MRRFVESSALVKRYVSETGSRWVSGIVDPASGNTIYAADISEVEDAALSIVGGRLGMVDWHSPFSEGAL